MKIVRAAGAGFLLGFLDFVWIKYVPWPLGDLGNSMAIWAVAAFLLAYLARWGLPTSAAAAMVLLIVAVPSYYLAAALIQHDDWSNMWSGYALLWMGFGLVGGAVFGIAGALARRDGWIRLVALSLPGGVLVAEAVLLALRDRDDAGVVVVRLVLAVLLTLAVAPTWRLRAAAALCLVPVGAVGYGLLSAAGFA
ncbi:DUF6518 family protein [Actinoplanes sp. RD1]|uniref:DUF6518 family protein n=1 Tax=Actinoplanes sp. RD1 TaxID=3064538 RepID=UPI002740B006|nr:DUF6518 family protein [Actinoplanes sp. RD1]